MVIHLTGRRQFFGGVVFLEQQRNVYYIDEKKVVIIILLRFNKEDGELARGSSFTIAIRRTCSAYVTVNTAFPSCTFSTNLEGASCLLSKI